MPCAPGPQARLTQNLFGGGTASVAEDGTCVIVPLYDDDDDAHASSASSDIVRCECDAPVRSIALDPKFATRRSRRFVRGGDDGALVLSSIGPPSRSGSTTSSQGRHDVVLHDGENKVPSEHLVSDFLEKFELNNWKHVCGCGKKSMPICFGREGVKPLRPTLEPNLSLR